MTEFKEQLFQSVRSQEVRGDFRDLTLEDLLGDKDMGEDLELPLQLIAERERQVAEAEKGVLSLINAMEAGIRSWQEAEEHRWNELKHAAIQYAVALAERIIDVKVRMDTDAIEKAVDKLLAEKAPSERATLRIHPMDARRLKKLPHEIFDRAKTEGILRVEEDPTIAQGTATLDTESLRLGVDYRERLAHLEELVKFGTGEESLPVAEEPLFRSEATPETPAPETASEPQTENGKTRTKGKK